MSTRVQQMNDISMRRAVPAFFLGVGAVCLVAATVGGHLGIGLAMIGVMALCSLAVILLGRRSETYRGITEESDERFALIGQRAWAGTGVILTLGNLGAFVGDLATGGSGGPYAWMVGVGAVAYIAFVALGRRYS